MIIRVRNMQPVGGAALPVGQYTIEPGWTSPPMEVEKDTPLDEIINTWVEDGIAMVLPSEDEGGIVGAIQKKRKTAILTLDQARDASARRGTMRRTSLDINTIHDVPEVPRRKSGNSTIGKARILTAADIKPRTEMSHVLSQPVVEEAIKTAQAQPPDEAQMMPPPPAEEAPIAPVSSVETHPEPVIEEAPVEVTPVAVESEEEAEEVKTEMEDQDDAEERAKALVSLTNGLRELTKNTLMDIAETLKLEVKPAMLKDLVIEVVACHMVAEGLSMEDIVV